MAPYTTMDWKKYMHALGKRDVRRTTAKVRRADLDPETYNEIARSLEQVEARLFVAVFVDGADDSVEDGTSLVDGHMNTYSHGRPVTTRIDWGGGFATLVNHPDPHHPEELRSA